MNFIKTFSELYSTETGEVTILLLLWLIWPGLMFVVGAIWESRLVPIWQFQSKAFIPGDFALVYAVMKLAEMYLATLYLHTWGKRPIWWAVACLVATIIAGHLQGNDAKNYPPRARYSPTKLTHDFIGYFLITFLVIAMLVPQIWLMCTSPNIVTGVTSQWRPMISGFVIYAVCVAYDFSAPPTDLEIALRHPADWHPLWRRD
ncbi:hypothetical protein IJH33_02260 [Candidatus Saccharibacteria bacterium]|nr:hypothetical protein [Candidatus Saccharibacteria bacterium]